MAQITNVIIIIGNGAGDDNNNIVYCPEENGRMMDGEVRPTITIT